MNELYLQDYILKQISRKYNHKHHNKQPADEIEFLFGRITKDCFHKSIPNVDNLFNFLMKEIYIFPDYSICSSIDEFESSKELYFPDEYVKYAGLIFGSLKSRYFADTEVDPIIFEKTCENLKRLNQEGSLKINKMSPIKRPDVKTKGNISGASIQYEYGKSFPLFNRYYFFGKYYLENLTKNDIKNLLVTINEIQKNTLVINENKVQLPHGWNLDFTSDKVNHQSIRLDCLTYLKRNNAIIDFKIIETSDKSLSDTLIEVETRFAGLEIFTGKLVETKIGKSMINTPPIEAESLNNIDGNKKQREIIYQITYSMNNEILLNDKKRLGKPNLGSENEAVMEYLMANSNKKITKKDIEDKMEIKIGKDFHKIVENLGFTGDLRKIFFKISKSTILFRNPITETDLEKLGIPPLEIKK